MSNKRAKAGSGCWKKAYAKLSHAIEAAKKVREGNLASTLHAYRCPRCGRFHIGHDRER